MKAVWNKFEEETKAQCGNCYVLKDMEIKGQNSEGSIAKVLVKATLFVKANYGPYGGGPCNILFDRVSDNHIETGQEKSVEFIMTYEKFSNE